MPCSHTVGHSPLLVSTEKVQCMAIDLHTIAKSLCEYFSSSCGHLHTIAKSLCEYISSSCGHLHTEALAVATYTL